MKNKRKHCFLIGKTSVSLVLKPIIQYQIFKKGYPFINGYPFFMHDTFEVDKEKLVARAVGRRICKSCGATYHIVYAPTAKEGICDKCGGELILRDDDKPETVLKRLGVYHEQTQPLIDYYTEAGVLREVDGTIDINDVFAAIVQILGE